MVFGSQSASIGNATGGLPLNGLAILNAFPTAVALLDGDGVVRYANPECRHVFPDGLAAGDPYTQAYVRGGTGCTDALAHFEAGLREVLAGHAELFTAELGRPRGGRVQVTVSSAQPAGLEGALVIHTLLPGTSAESEDRRRQAERMEAMGRLVGGVAHDFANLLTLISGYSEIMLNRMPAGQPLPQELEEIRKAANRGARLTAQLLGFTRGQAVEPRLLDLNALIGDMEKMLRPIIGEYIDLETSLAAELNPIKADPGQMEQVIMNLVLNARDAMPRGGTIRIETANTELNQADAALHEVAPGSYVVLSFTDTGQGMDDHVLSHLFEPFFTTKEKGKGTGLGLSTVYSIVKQSGGDVWARSVPGEGTTFTICLPRAQPEDEAADAAAAHPTLEGSETILLVEDEEAVRRLLYFVLTRQGYTVLDAADGRAALDILAHHSGPIHLLLTDMIMPHMSGREVAERCRTLRPETRVIYMSGYTDDVLLRTGALGPGMSFLQKPLRPEVLLAKVREVLDRPGRAPREVS